MDTQLPNRKQETFARAVAEGNTYTHAYELAGYSPSTSNASNLARRPDVAARIAFLKTEHEKREAEFRLLMKQAEGAPDPQAAIKAGLDWTMNRVMDLIAENARLAQIAGEYKAATECLKLLGDALNLFEKASNSRGEGKSSGAQGTLALIGQVTQVLAGPGGYSDPEESNPLAPRL